MSRFPNYQQIYQDFASGKGIQDNVGFRIPPLGFWIPPLGFWIPPLGFWIPPRGFRIQSARLIQDCLSLKLGFLITINSKGNEWSSKIFNCSQILPLLDLLAKFNECSLARAPQIFALLASSQSKFFISARAHKKIAVLGMLANARKNYSSPLIVRF